MALSLANETWGVIAMKRVSVIVVMSLVILLCFAFSPVTANESGVVNGTVGSDNITGVINAEVVSVPISTPENPPILNDLDPGSQSDLIDFPTPSTPSTDTGSTSGSESYVFVTKWGTYGSGDGHLDLPTCVAVDSSGNVYIGDTNNNRIQKFSSTGTLLEKWGSSGSGDGQFQHPEGITVDSLGNIYIADTNNHRIQKFSSTWTFLAKWGSYGTGDGQVRYPTDVAVDSSGNVYVADYYNNRIQKFSSTGTFITKWGTQGSGEGQFSAPTGIAVDSSGNVYIGEAGNNRIQKFSSAGSFITKWGASGSGDGQFNTPQGVEIDSFGAVYVADRANNRIQKFAPSSANPPVANFVGNPTSGAAPLPVSFTDLSSNSPTGWAWFFGDENFTTSWTQVNASAGWSARSGHSSVVMPDGSIVLMGGYNGGGLGDVWRSTDNGATWTQQIASAGWGTRWGLSSVARPDGSIVLMGGYTGSIFKNDVWRSTDNGATWTQLTANAGWSARYAMSIVAMLDGSIVLMGGWNGSSCEKDVWRSTDNGTTWVRQTASAGWSARYFHGSVAMPDGSIMLTGGYDGSNKNDVWRSTDNGAKWTQVNASAGWSARHGHSSVAMPDGSIVLAGGCLVNGESCRNDVWRSTDNGATWTQVNANAGWTVRGTHTVAMPDSSIVLMGGNTRSIFKNDVWQFMPTGSSVQNPLHTYTTPGNYSVALQAYNTGGYNSMRKTGYIKVSSGIVAPVANFVGTPTSGTAPLTVTFTDLSTNMPTTWIWDFGDGSLVNATVQNPVHTYTSNDNYTVSLTATNTAGSNTKTSANYITVSSGGGVPIANFVGTPTSGTAPLTVTFTDLSTNMPTYSSAQNQQESGSGLIPETIPTQVISTARNSIPETIVPFVEATSTELQEAPFNPEFVRQVEEKPYGSQQLIGSSHLGLVPAPISRPEVRDIQMFGQTDGDRFSSYPSSFDLRTSGKVSPVKDQGHFNTCWAFATFASLESTLMPTTPTPDFSEKNLANLAGFDVAIPNGGGNMWMSTAYLSRWNGPVNETTDLYPSNSWTVSNTYTPVKHVQKVVFFPARSDRADTGNIKGALTQWGAVYSSLYWDDSFYNAAHTSYYQPSSAANPVSGGGHAVTIIGWDDTYAVTNFNTAPALPGAWIVKNSWGTTWGNSGYFFVSYYDKYFGSALQSGTYRDTAAFLGESTSNYTTVYSYDKLGEVTDYYYGTNKTGSFANIFTATSSGTIKAVGVYTTDLNVPCTISIYKNPTSGPVGGTPAVTFSETLSTMGYNTVIIPSSQQIPITMGDKFSVVVQVTNPTYNYYIPVEKNLAGYSSGITSQFEQSYGMNRSGVWIDWKTKVDNSHICVKAYTSSTTIPSSWYWSFGDGSSSISENPTHTYTTAGSYPVSLTATNSAGSNTTTKTNYITVIAPQTAKSTIGMYRNGVYYLRNSNTAGNADLMFAYGSTGDIPVTGDWNGDGIDTIGMYRNGVYYLRNSNTAGNADIVFAYGSTGDIPVTGDWDGDGIDTIGMYRNGVYYLRNSNTAGNADLMFAYGSTGDIPVTGDWDGNGFDTIGMYRNGVYYLRNSNTAGNADIMFAYGSTGDIPVTGDWNDDGIDTIGMYRNGVYYLRNTNTQGDADLAFAYGAEGDKPVTGRWI